MNQNINSDPLSGANFGAKPSAFGLGPYTVIPSTNAINHGQDQDKIEPRVMEVLTLLASQAGQVVTRDAFIEALWQVQYGADESLTRAISVLRKTLKRYDPDTPYIETIPKRGYRLLVEPEWETFVPDLQSTGDTELDLARSNQAASNFGLSGFAKGLIAALVLIGLALGWFLIRPGQKSSDDTRIQAEQVAPKSEKVSIAVLPFEPLSSNPEDEFFGDGITEELLNELARFPELNVAARTSTFQFKGQTEDIREVARKLGVDYVVEGSVRRNDEKIRVVAQLIRADDGFHVWSETFDQPLNDIFVIQDKIVTNIHRSLEIRLGVGIGRGVEPKSDVDPDALEQYYRGLHFWANRMRVDGAFTESYTAFQAAVEIDPDFAEAWGYLAFTAMAGSPIIGRDTDQFLKDSKLIFERAAEMNPENGDLHAGLAMWYSSVIVDPSKARLHIERSKELSPDSSTLTFTDGVYNFMIGNPVEATKAYSRGISINPNNLVAKNVRSVFYATTGRFNDAFEFLNECHETDCLKEGFVPYAAFAAYLSKDPDRIAKWDPLDDAFGEFMEKNVPLAKRPEYTEIHTAVSAIHFNRPNKAEKIAFLNEFFADRLVTDHIGIWGPTVSQVIPRDRFMDVLEKAHERGDLLSSLYAMSPFYGYHPYPDWVLEHPRYHAIWKEPGMKELAELRRANGWHDGLPKDP